MSEEKVVTTAMVKAEKASPLSKVRTTEELPISEAVKVLMTSGLVKSTEDLGKVIAKVSFGRGLGLSDVAAINGLSFSPNGTLILSAALMLALIKRSGKYRLEYKQRTDKVCEIQVFEKVDGEWHSCGVPCKFTWDDAVRAGLSTKQTYKQYPTQLLTARCISDCFRTHCSDVTGVGVYTPEEIPDSGLITHPETGDIIPEAEYEVKTPAPAPRGAPAAALTDQTLIDLAKETKADLPKLLAGYGVQSVDKLTTRQLEQAVQILRMKLNAPVAK